MALDLRKFTLRFVDEARDHLRRLDEGLTALQANPVDAETINTIFRSAHTIKGSSRMLKLTEINETAHKLEDVLGALRDGSLAHTPELGRLLQRSMDAIAAQVDRVATGTALEPVDPSLCAELAALVPVEMPAPAINQASTPPPSPQPSPPPPPPSIPPSAPVETHLKSLDTVRVPLSRLDDLIKLMGEVVSSHASLRQRLIDIREIERDELRTGNSVANRLKSFSQLLKDDVLSQELLMEELHGKALVMRMLPLSIVFDSAPRMVRELARSIGKEVECVVEGAEIELDRQLIDRLSDPIVHLLRNAVDHGVEDAAKRQAAGKPRLGRIRLSARQDAGGVAIEISDDGGGILIDAIRDKAVRKGLLIAEQAATLSENETVDLIFLPGFSTNAIITDISGRGVGMDVVKRCIVDELQGAIAVETRQGIGTTFVLRLPLSLAVMRTLLVEAGAETFSFTAQQVTMLLRLPPGRLVTVAERQAVVIDNEFVPVESLAALVSLPEKHAETDRDLLLVVVQVGIEKLALKIDDLVDERDMVIKSLPAHLSHIALVSGMVMTGKNALVGVLHAPALLDLARTARGHLRQKASETGPERIRVLVVDDSLNTREIERDVLAAHGYLVTMADDGLDGLQKARREAFDAVLTDVEMPNMDGFTLTASLRADERYRDVPIIIITSRQKEQDKRRGIEVGADAYIVKGDFDQSGLINTLRALLG